jgi:ATP-dependent DNA helicase RecQ
VGDPLFDALRALRREIAQEANVPPYVVFHDAVLRDMAASKPMSLADLAAISGVGTRKRDAYGDRFLATIRAYA